MKTRTWKVYGEEGHRQRESFRASVLHLETESGAIISLLNADITGTNDYSIIVITAENEARCEAELFAQLSDGLFENSRVGSWEEVEMDGCLYKEE